MRRHLICIPLLVISACSIEERGAPGTNPETTLDLNNSADSLAVTLSAPAKARRGDEVPIVITVRNATARTLELALAGREIAFDMIVTRDDSIVWQRLAGATIPSILQLKKLLPNESFELMDRWKADVEAGTFLVAAKILTDGDPLAPRQIPIVIQQPAPTE